MKTLISLLVLFLFLAFGIFSFKMLEPEVFIPLAVTFFTAAGGLTATLWTTTYNKKQQVDADFREKKIAIYLSFVELLSNQMQVAKNSGKDEEPPADLIEALRDIRTKATLWSSPEVLVALNDLGKAGDKNFKKMFYAVDRIQRAMRTDLGLSNKGLEELFFVKHLLKSDDDVEELMKMIK